MASTIPASDYDWMRTRPPDILAMMRRFPPSCRVRLNAEHEHRALRPGIVCQVVSYIAPGANNPDGVLGVVDLETGEKGRTLPEFVEVCGYWGNQTPVWVERVLGGEDVPVERGPDLRGPP